MDSKFILAIHGLLDRFRISNLEISCISLDSWFFATTIVLDKTRGKQIDLISDSLDIRHDTNSLQHSLAFDA